MLYFVRKVNRFMVYSKICAEKILHELSVYMSFPAKGGGKRVDMDVCYTFTCNLPKEGRYVQTHFKKFLSLSGACTAMLGDWQFVFQKKELIKYPNKFKIEGEEIVMTLVPLSCRMLHVVLGLKARLDGTLSNLV